MLYNKQTKKPLGKDELVVGEEVMVEHMFGDEPFPATVLSPTSLESTHHLMTIAWEDGEWRVLGYGNKAAVQKIEMQE